MRKVILKNDNKKTEYYFHNRCTTAVKFDGKFMTTTKAWIENIETGETLYVEPNSLIFISPYIKFKTDGKRRY